MPNEKPAEKKGGSVKGVEVLKPGHYTDHNGKQVDITEETMAQLAANFAANPNVPLVVGHLESKPTIKTDTPAAGWFERLYVSGGKLLADIGNIPESVAKWIDAKAYRKVSLAYDPKTMRPLHLALLGAMPPAVEGMADFPQVTMAKAEQDDVVVLLSAVEQGGTGGDPMPDEVKKDEAKPDPPAAAPKPDEAAVILAQVVSRLSALEARTVRADERAHGAEVENLKSKVAALKAAQKLTPGEESAFVALATSLLSIESIVELAGSDGKPVKKSAYAAFIELAEARPAMAVLGEKAKDGKAGDEKGTPAINLARTKAEAEHSKFFDDNAVMLSKTYTRDAWVAMQLLADGFPPVTIEEKDTGDEK